MTTSYASGLDPNTANNVREVLSPYKVTVLLFIEKYSEVVLKGNDGSRPDEGLTSKERKDRSLLLFKLLQGGDLPFDQLCKAIDTSPINKKHAINWRQSIRQVLREGIEGLQNLFDAVNRAMHHDMREAWSRFSATVLGLFMRRINVMFKLLSMTEIVALHSMFATYVSSIEQEELDEVLPSPASEDDSLPSALDISMASPPSSPSLLSTPSCSSTARVADSTQEDTPPPTQPASKGKKKKLADPGPTPSRLTRDMTQRGVWSVQQAENLIGEQTQLIEFNESKAMKPKELHDVLQQILVAHPHLSAAHYLTCLNYLRVNEARGAVESLAAAYDCQQVTRATPRTLRYAALNMAALYSHFGSSSVALRCVSEAIAQSQEASDNTCLQHALAWLYALAPHSKRESLIETAVQRTSALQLPYLSWLSLVNKAAHSSGKPPAHHLQMLVSRADGCVGVMGGGAGGYGGVWGVEAGVWGGWLGGCSAMATVCSQLVLHAPPSLPQQPGLPFASSQTAAALCSMAAALADMGEYVMCRRLLSHARELFHSTSPYAQYVRFTEAHVTCTHYTLLGDFSQALRTLTSVASEHPLYVKIRSCEVAVAQGETESALRQVTALLAKEEVKTKPQLLVVVKLLYASALCIANNAEAAVHGLVETVFLAKDNHLALLHSLANLQLLAVQLQLRLLPPSKNKHKNYQRVDNPNIHTYNYYCLSPAVDVDMLDQAMSVVLSSGSLFDQARALLLVAKLRILAATDQPEKLGRAAKDLERVKNMFTKVEALYRVRDVLYLSARTWHSAGQIEARNKSSFEFRTLENAHPCMQILPPTPIF